MSVVTQIRSPKPVVQAESQAVNFVRRLGSGFPLFVAVGFMAVAGIMALPSSLRLAGWEEPIAILLAPALVVFLSFAARQAWTGLKELRDSLTWWHGLWFLILVSSLVFRIRDAAEAQSLPIDAYATLRIIPEFLTGLFLVIYFLNRRGALRASLFQGLAGVLCIYGLVCLVSTVWSVKPSWTVYKSCEFLLDLAVLGAVLATVKTREVYNEFFNWTLILCGLELLWTWVGAVIWPEEALYSTYPPRLTGVFPIQSANAIGASGAILAIVALCRLLPLAGCRFQRAWNILLFAFGVASMIACKTRAAMGGFAVALLLLLAFSARARRASVFGVAALLSLYTVLLVFRVVPSPEEAWKSVGGSGGQVASFLERGQDQEQMESLTGRLEWWHLAWEQFKGHPFTGLGAYAGGKFGVLAKSGLGETPQLHSDYLEVLVGTSFWGVIPLLVALFGTWRLLVRFVRSPQLQPLDRQLALEAVAVLGVLTVRSLVNVELIWHAPQFFLAVLGYAELLRRKAKAECLEVVPMTHGEFGRTRAWSQI
jgi:O-antigen ligase